MIDQYLLKKFGSYALQENMEFDGMGNEIYHGWATNLSKSSDPNWFIQKGIYTNQGNNVYVMTHVSFLIDQVWDNRASLVFP